MLNGWLFAVVFAKETHPTSPAFTSVLLGLQGIWIRLMIAEFNRRAFAVLLLLCNISTITPTCYCQPARAHMINVSNNNDEDGNTDV